jgi:hypothetical protein
MLQPIAAPTPNTQPNGAFVQSRGDAQTPSNGGVSNLTVSAVSQNDETGETNRDDEQGRERRSEGERDVIPFGRADAQASGRGVNLDIVV